jgi:hypothetical protein
MFDHRVGLGNGFHDTWKPARSLRKTLAAMIAPYSVKAVGGFRRPPVHDRT